VELLGDVAHELRTPISTLEGSLEGLLDVVVEPSPETWARLHGEAGQLHRLVSDVQDLSRAESRQLALKLQAVDPAQIAEIALARLRQPLADQGLTVVTQIPARLPAVPAGPDRAAQVLTNALRYTPAAGQVSLSISRTPAGNEVLFPVADSGMGLAAEHLPHLFERFYRVDKSRSRAVGGSGIGLTIARAIVEAMGGRIWAESPGPGQGSTFSFTLPVADGAA
jgi:two-component system, OmpR family, sensor histidine kinase BaeS